MKVTTVRFGTDLWRLLEEEADRVGVSVSQYIREAALARAAAAAAARGADPLEVLGLVSSATPSPPGDPRPVETTASRATRHADELRSEAEALVAESRQAIRHSQKLMERSDDVTENRHGVPSRREPQK